MSDDWFRNTSWDTAIARRFEEKLRRARRKEQYLRIQACHLAPIVPQIALELLDRYFALSDTFDHAQAHVDRAVAFKALGRLEESAQAYEAALAREATFPNLKTQAYLDLPILVATAGLRARFERALEVLEHNRNRLMFPLDHFLWHCAYALLCEANQDRERAVMHAKNAMAAAAREKSGFRYHPSLGLVTEKHRALLDALASVSPA